MIDDTGSREPGDALTSRTGRGAMIFAVVFVGYILSPIPLAFGLHKAGSFECLEKPFYVFMPHSSA